MAHAAGNGQMVAFMAASRAMVDAAHEAAVRHGGATEGAPGLRPEYHAHYYAAYVRDPDGNCLDSWDHVPIRSWPLFKARNVLRTLFQSDFSLATR